MEKQLYRIKVEAIGNEEVTRELEKILEGEECEGFVMILRKPDGRSCVIMHEVSKTEFAEMIECDKDVMAAAYIAEGMHKARELLYRQSKPNSFERVLGDLMKNDNETQSTMPELPGHKVVVRALPPKGQKK